jgi:hypothetical protein
MWEIWEKKNTWTREKGKREDMNFAMGGGHARVEIVASSPLQTHEPLDNWGRGAIGEEDHAHFLHDIGEEKRRIGNGPNLMVPMMG